MSPTDRPEGGSRPRAESGGTDSAPARDPGFPPREAPPTAGTLDERIRAAERRLIEREERLHVQARALRGRVQRAVRPGAVAASVAGVVASGGVLGWIAWRWRRTGVQPALDTPVGPTSTRRAAPRRELPWVPLIGMAWPMLPARWRARVSPASAAALASVGLPLLQRLFERRLPAPPAPLAQWDTGRFAGGWYEVGRLGGWLDALHPAPAPMRTLDWRWAGGGFVIDRRSRGGEREQGVARVVPGPGARLEWSFLQPAWLRWFHAAWSPRWLLHVDEGYRVALLGSPDRRELSVMSRSPRLSPAQWTAVEVVAAAKGFAVARLRRTAG